MIIKQKDSITPKIEQLECLLLQDITQTQKSNIETQLKIMRSGIKGEESSAYFIDFHFGESKNWMALHDLRFEYQGNIAQIDHLIINRFLHFYVLETKNYSNAIQINESGEFQVLYGGKSKPIESPIEQNKRHIFLLERYFNSIDDIFPKRLGLKIKPSFHSYILVSPSSKIIRPDNKIFDTSNVIKSDSFFSLTQEKVNEDSVFDLAKVIGQDTLYNLAHRIAELHKPPASIDYSKRFGVNVNPNTITEDSTSLEKDYSNLATNKINKGWKSGYFCANCRVNISKKVAMFCFQNKQKFGGKAYCFECQKLF